MSDLITWLRAQLDDDERVARAASPGYLPDDPLASDEDRAHVARWQQARVLVEVDAKRRIIDEYELWAEEQSEDYEHAQTEHDSAQALLAAIKLLALPYADRPGYREEWRP